MASSVATSIPSLSPAREIPATFAASFKSWWAAGEKESAASEERLLRKLSFFLPSSVPDDSSLPVTARINKVELSRPHHYLNTLSMLPKTPSPTAPPPTVLLHGYGAGLGFFFLNFASLGSWAAQRGASVYAVDWLGMGRSARVPFKVKAKRDDVRGRVQEAENFFVDSLEDWRIKMGLDKMTLVGHSLGAYFSVAYALRHPTRVSRLILLSPAGVPHDPNTTVPSREIESAPASPTSSFQAVPANNDKVAEIKEEQVQAKRQESTLRKVFTYLWEEGWSPFQVARGLGFWAPMIIGKYSSRRFSVLNEEDTRDMHDYIMNITLAKGSGEYCISHILAPGAHARMPLVDRVAPIKVPITFVYGDHDWMDPEGGSLSVQRLREAGNMEANMYIVPDSGHHVYLDNARAVNKLLLKELDKGRKSRSAAADA